MFAPHVAQCFHHGDISASATDRRGPGMVQRDLLTMVGGPSLFARCVRKRRPNRLCAGSNGLCKRGLSFRHTMWTAPSWVWYTWDGDELQSVGQECGGECAVSRQTTRGPERCLSYSDGIGQTSTRRHVDGPVHGCPHMGTKYMWGVLRVAWSLRSVMRGSQAETGAHTAAGLLAGQACRSRLHLFLRRDGVVQGIPDLRQFTEKVNTMSEFHLDVPRLSSKCRLPTKMTKTRTAPRRQPEMSRQSPQRLD